MRSEADRKAEAAYYRALYLYWGCAGMDSWYLERAWAIVVKRVRAWEDAIAAPGQKPIRHRLESPFIQK